MDRQPLFVLLYERDEAGDPADWPERTETHSLRAKVVKRTAGFVPPASPLLCGCRGGIPHRNSPLPSGSLAEQAVRSGRPEYAEEDGIGVSAKPVLWKGRVAKVRSSQCPTVNGRCWPRSWATCPGDIPGATATWFRNSQPDRKSDILPMAG